MMTMISMSGDRSVALEVKITLTPKLRKDWRAAWNGRQRVKPIKRTRKRQIAKARWMMAEHDHTCYEWSQRWPTPARKPKGWKR